jgi:hypothetical protein
MKPVMQDQINNEVLHHIQTDPHKRASGLSNFILGARTEWGNVLGVMLGFAAATNDARIVLVAGFSNFFSPDSCTSLIEHIFADPHVICNPFHVFCQAIKLFRY